MYLCQHCIRRNVQRLGKRSRKANWLEQYVHSQKGAHVLITKLLACNSYCAMGSSQAALCAVRIIRKVPDLLDHFVSRSTSLLSDRNHGVLLCGVVLVTNMCAIDNDTLLGFRKVIQTHNCPCQRNTTLTVVLPGRTLTSPAPESSQSSWFLSRA